MIIEDYGTALKKLTVMTQTKNLVLAHITGYDISYISKWCNGIKLPATKYIEKTNDQLSQYFAETIAKENKKIELCSMLSISADSDDITFEINQYLNAAYRSSMKKNTKRQKDFMSSVKVIAGNHDAAKFIHELFKEKLSHITVETELLILGEFCILTDMGFWKCFESTPLRASRLTIRIGLDMNTLASDPKYMRKLYTLLNRLLNYDFIFYDYTYLKHANMIIMENQFAIQYALQADESIGICTYIPDPVLVQDIYDRFSLRFSTQNPILASAKVLGIDELGFRTAFYSVNNFFFFLTNGFDFLLPSQSIDDFLKEIHASPRVIRQISHLRIMWEELLSRVNVEFMLPTTSIIRYIETGYMFFTDAEYRMKAEDRKSHIKNIIYTMKKNPHIVMGVLQSSTETAEYYESNLSFYSNFSSAFLKKNPQYITNEASPFYIVSSQKLVSIFHVFFNELKQLPTYHQYTYTEVHDKYEKYKNFIERTIDLHNHT